MANAVKVIDVKESGETTIELTVILAQRLLLKCEASMAILWPAWVAGLTDCVPITFKLPEPTATVYALDPVQPRTPALYHPEKKIGAIVNIRGDEKEPVTAKLAPSEK